MEGSADPIYHSVRRPHLRQLKSEPFTQKLGHAQTRAELHELRAQLADLLIFFEAMRGAFKVLHWLARLAKPVAYIVMLGTACMGFWTAVRAGGGGR